MRNSTSNSLLCFTTRKTLVLSRTTLVQNFDFSPWMKWILRTSSLLLHSDRSPSSLKLPHIRANTPLSVTVVRALTKTEEKNVQLDIASQRLLSSEKNCLARNLSSPKKESRRRSTTTRYYKFIIKWAYSPAGPTKKTDSHVNTCLSCVKQPLAARVLKQEKIYKIV